MLKYFAEVGFAEDHIKGNLITYCCKNRSILNEVYEA